MSSQTPNRRQQEEQAQAIVEDVVRRRRAGEVVRDEDILRDWPDLFGVLQGLLRRAAFVELARDRSSGRLEAYTGPAESAPEPPPPAEPVRESGDAARLTADEQELAAAAASETAPPGTATEPELSTEGEPPELIGEQPEAVLRVFDPNESRSAYRLRKDRVTLGRAAGDIVLPHDPLLSATHAMIERRQADGSWSWTLRDLGSTNGVFARARRVRLTDGDYLLIANRLVRFAQRLTSGPGRLEEVRQDGNGQSLTLEAAPGAVYWIGSDETACGPFLASAPQLDSRFARLTRDEQGRWTIHADESLSGLWIRVARIALRPGSAFRLGGQHFSFHSA